MPTIGVDELRFDDDIEEKLWRHGLTSEQVQQIRDHPHRVRKNRSQRRASHLLFGRDDQAQWIAVAISPTESRHV